MFQSQRPCSSCEKALELELLMFTSPAVLLEQTCNGRQVILGYLWVRGWLVFGGGNPWRWNLCAAAGAALLPCPAGGTCCAGRAAGREATGEAIWTRLKLNSIRHSSPELKGQILCLVHALSSYFVALEKTMLASEMWAESCLFIPPACNFWQVVLFFFPLLYTHCLVFFSPLWRLFCWI